MNYSGFKQAAAVLLVALGAYMLTGCGMGSARVRSNDYPFDFHLNCLFDDRHVVILLVDGCRADLLYDMARRGDLPVIKKYLIDRGVSAEHAIAPIPPVTNAAVAAITCGVYPGHLDVIGGRWFDRKLPQRSSVFSLKDYYTTNQYLSKKTVYEVLADEPTVAIATRCSRGSTYDIPFYYNLIGMKDYLLGRWNRLDEVFVKEFNDVADCANREGIFPRVTFVHLAGLDPQAHHTGPFSADVRANLKNLDGTLGPLMAQLERNGALERICFILVADHGHVPLGEKNYLIWKKYFSDEIGLPMPDGYRGIDRPDTPARRKRHYERFAVIDANNGRNTFLHFRHNPAGRWISPRLMAPWEARPTWEELRNYQTPRGPVDLVEKMRRAQGIGLVIGQPRTGEIAIFSADGESRIRTREINGETRYMYEVVSGRDPLGYRDSPAAQRLMDGNYHSSREWLQATCALPQPDVVAQLPSVFESPCCGDLFVISPEGWDFEKANVSSHGGFLRGEMNVPLVIAGPHIRHGRIGAVRSVDLVPTILDYLGHGDRIEGLGLDGESFWKEIEARGNL